MTSRATSKELLAQLNALRIENGKAELASWKAGMPKLEAAIETEQQSIAKRMADEGEGINPEDLPTAEPVSQEDASSNLSDPEVGQSENQVDRTDPTMPMGENGNSLVDPIEPEQKPEGEKIPRGAINAMCVELLQTDMPYEDIVAAIKECWPTARTTARSLASVAMDLRADGLKVPTRRKPAAAKPAKTEGEA